MELDDRKATILRAIVEEHITTAQPVGSQTIARSRNLGVSSATVRNDMTVLEREGYLTHPHTSAGRVPTDAGYRRYADDLIESATVAGPCPVKYRSASSASASSRPGRRGAGTHSSSSTNA